MNLRKQWFHAERRKKNMQKIIRAHGDRLRIIAGMKRDPFAFRKPAIQNQPHRAIRIEDQPHRADRAGIYAQVSFQIFRARKAQAG